MRCALDGLVCHVQWLWRLTARRVCSSTHIQCSCNLAQQSCCAYAPTLIRAAAPETHSAVVETAMARSPAHLVGDRLDRCLGRILDPHAARQLCRFGFAASVGAWDALMHDLFFRRTHRCRSDCASPLRHHLRPFFAPDRSRGHRRVGESVRSGRVARESTAVSQVEHGVRRTRTCCSPKYGCMSGFLA